MPLISPAPPPDIRRTNLYIPLLAYVAGILFFLLAGFQTFRQIERLIQQNKLDDLNAIAAMKIGQIVSWRETQQRRGEVISQATLLPVEFEQWVREGATTGQRKQKIAQMMSGWRQLYSYRAAALVDRQGAVRLAPSGGTTWDAEEIELARQAMQEGKTILSDIHNDSGNGETNIDLAAPLIVDDGNRSRVVGAVILHINPGDFLFPLIQSWPVHTSTAETLLVRQEGDNLLFLNELRHIKGKAMTLRRPVNTPDLPPGMFLRGKLDPLNSVDYRGVPVVASVSRIPGTTWLMVAKIDKAELFAPIRQIKHWSVAVGLIFLGGCGVLFFVWFQSIQTRYRHLKTQRDAAIHSGLMLKHFEYLTQYANDIILVADDNGRITEANDRAVSAYGYTRDELLQMQIWDLRPSNDDLSAFHEQISHFRESGGLTFETTNRRKDGSIFPVEISARAIELEGVNYLQGIIRDITERKAAEQRIARLNDLYATISQTNSAIVRIKNRATLLQEICRIVVEHGHFRLAWVGLTDMEHGYIKPVASSGLATGYLDGLIIPIDAEKEEGQGPTGAALSQGQATICNDFQADPRTLPWHDNARKYGLCSSAAWPLMLAGKSMGALNLYAGETNYFDDEMVQLLSSVSQDISFALDNLAMEETLRQSEEKFRTLVENLPQNIFVKDSDLVYVSCNMAYATALGITPDKISGMTDYDFYPTELAEKYRRDDQSVLNSGEIKYIQEDYIEQGQQKSVQTIKAPFRNQQGKVIGVLGMFWDITERKRAEVLEQRFGHLLQNSFNEIYLFDADSLHFIETSEGARKNLGYSADELIRMTPLDIKPTLDSSSFERLVAPLRSGEQPSLLFETSHRRKDGTTYPVEARLQFMAANPPVFLAVIQDISERKRAADELRKYAERVEDLYNNAPCGYHSLDKNGVIVQINNTELQWLGYTWEEVVGKMNIRDLFTPRSRQLLQQTFSLFKKRGYAHDLAFEFIRKDGSVLPVMVNGTAIYGQDGEFVMSRSSVFDDSARRLAEESLRESEARFRAMADNAPIIIWMADAQGGQDYSGCGFFNQRWHDFTGLTLAQTQGQNWLERVHPDDRARCLKTYQEAFRLREPFKHEFRLMRHDTEYRWILDSGVPRYAENGLTENGKFIGFIGTCIDITEQKNSEAMRSEIERAGRLNIAVEMASGLAHELSQPLSAANNYLTGCLHRMKDAEWDKEKLRMALELTHKQTERAGSIINHLKNLIRKQGHERSMTDINALIRDMVDFLEHEIKQRGILVVMTLSPLPLVLVNKVEIEQVLINLFKNAIEAMRGALGAELRIVTTNLRDAGQIRVTVGDNGRGISSAELATIFNPFHTSKTDGLGLGLAICRSLVENHGGRIWADAQPGFGAEFNFTLPYEATHEPGFLG